MWAGNDERSKACGQEMMKEVKNLDRKCWWYELYEGVGWDHAWNKKNENVCFEKSDNVFGDVWIEKEKEEEWMNR